MRYHYCLAVGHKYSHTSMSFYSIEAPDFEAAVERMVDHSSKVGAAGQFGPCTTEEDLSEEIFYRENGV